MDEFDYLNCFQKCTVMIPTESAEAVTRQLYKMSAVLEEKLKLYLQELKWEIEDTHDQTLRKSYRTLRRYADDLLSKTAERTQDLRQRISESSFPSMDEIRRLLALISDDDNELFQSVTALRKQFDAPEYKKGEDDLFYNLRHFTNPLEMLVYYDHRRIIEIIRQELGVEESTELLGIVQIDDRVSPLTED